MFLPSVGTQPTGNAFAHKWHLACDCACALVLRAPPLPGKGGRSLHISTDAQDERVDLLLEEIAESEDAAERSTLLLELADLLDRGLEDPERALRAAQAALEEQRSSTAAADRCIALYERMSRWNDLANFLSDRLEQARSRR